MTLYTRWYFLPILQIGTLRLEITQFISTDSIKSEYTYLTEAFSDHTMGGCPFTLPAIHTCARATNHPHKGNSVGLVISYWLKFQKSGILYINLNICLLGHSLINLILTVSDSYKAFSSMSLFHHPYQQVLSPFKSCLGLSVCFPCWGNTIIFRRRQFHRFFWKTRLLAKSSMRNALVSSFTLWLSIR